MGQSLRAAEPTLTGMCCPVCGCREVRSDEVALQGWVSLHECPRCDHRWTRRAEPQAPRTRPLLRVASEVASAA